MKTSLIKIEDIALYISFIIKDEEEKNFRWNGFEKNKTSKIREHIMKKAKKKRMRENKANGNINGNLIIKKS